MLSKRDEYIKLVELWVEGDMSGPTIPYERWEEFFPGSSALIPKLSKNQEIETP